MNFVRNDAFVSSSTSATGRGHRRLPWLQSSVDFAHGVVNALLPKRMAREIIELAHGGMQTYQLVH
jgi:hypothetical protein